MSVIVITIDINRLVVTFLSSHPYTLSTFRSSVAPSLSFAPASPFLYFEILLLLLLLLLVLILVAVLPHPREHPHGTIYVSNLLQYAAQKHDSA